jgi:hypothetical protein
LGAQVEQVLQYRDRQDEYDDDGREADEITNVQRYGPVENLAESQRTKLHRGAFLQADSNPLPAWEPAVRPKSEAIPVVRRVEIHQWPDRDDPGRIDVVVREVIVTLDVIEVHGLGDAVNLV